MIYEQTIILKDDDSESFPDALVSAIEGLKTLATSCPTILNDTFKERAFVRSFKAEFCLDGKGVESLCVNLAERAALIIKLGGVTGIRYSVMPSQNTACFELIF